MLFVFGVLLQAAPLVGEIGANKFLKVSVASVMYCTRHPFNLSRHYFMSFFYINYEAHLITQKGL